MGFKVISMLAIFVLFGVFNLGTSLSCYYCSSTDENCINGTSIPSHTCTYPYFSNIQKDAFYNDVITFESGNVTPDFVCMTINIVNSKNAAVFATVRGCSAKECKDMRSFKDGFQVTCDQCSIDNCNGAL